MHVSLVLHVLQLSLLCIYLYEVLPVILGVCTLCTYIVLYCHR